MKFKELVDNPSLENKIKFQKDMILRQEQDIKENSDNGFGHKKRMLENMKRDLLKLENEYQRVNNQ